MLCLKDKIAQVGIIRIFSIVVLCLMSLIVVFSVVVYDQIESEELGDFFSDLKESFVKMYGGVTGLVVEEVEEVVEPEPELEEEPEVEVEEVEVEEVEVEEVEVEEAVVDVNGIEVLDEVVEEVVNETEVIEEVNITLVNETLVNVTLENITEVNVTLENITEINVTLENITEVNVTLENITEVNVTLENITEVNVTLENITEINVSEVSTLQYRAVIGRPVKWIKSVNISDGKNLSIEIPRDAVNISVLTDEEVGKALTEAEDFEEVVEVADREEMSEGVLLTGNVALDIREGEGLLTRIWNWLIGFTITGEVVLEEELIVDEVIVEMDSVMVVEVGEIVEETNASEVAVEYYTEAPVANESELVGGKRIVVSAPSELNYSEILAYTLIEQRVKMNDSRLKLYHFESVDEENLTEDLEGEVAELLANGSSGVRSEVAFVSYDFDADGYVDYIEWVVPHLSAQVYEVSITILNVQSYPTVGGNWTVGFNTTGEANLTVSAVNGTSYTEVYDDNEATQDDLEILELRCGDETLFDKYGLVDDENVYLILENDSFVKLNETLNKSLGVKSIFVENYSCNSTGYYTVKVLTPGIHDQLFDFGGINASAHNLASDWFNSSWTYKKDITINHSKVNGSQVNFPVLINLTDTDLRDDALSNGDDIVFTNSTGIQLDHEIEYFNGTDGRLVAWVRIPTLSNVSDTVINMYYGNAGASNQENATGVWDDNFVMVQ
ncbi:DUF2341 domain-containing protein, partial [Candidatus Pacearchaeota archaeon]|nr:DUF2341 domain-containing protein [Candidatus Pacearchaeota archaeon]